MARTRTYSWNLKRAIEKHGYTPKELAPNARYEAGKTYWCGYWQKHYEVIEAEYDNNTGRLKSVTVKWDDGKIGQHCTLLDTRRDWLLIPAA
jgi:hypothetical protein